MPDTPNFASLSAAYQEWLTAKRFAVPDAGAPALAPVCVEYQRWLSARPFVPTEPNPAA